MIQRENNLTKDHKTAPGHQWVFYVVRKIHSEAGLDSHRTPMSLLRSEKNPLGGRLHNFSYCLDFWWRNNYITRLLTNICIGDLRGINFTWYKNKMMWYDWERDNYPLPHRPNDKEVHTLSFLSRTWFA